MTDNAEHENESIIYSSPDCVRTGARMTEDEVEEMNRMERALAHREP